MRRAWIEADFEGPDAGLSIGGWNAEEVRAFPVAVGISGGAEVAELCPLLEIWGGVKANLVLFWQGDGHDPMPGGWVPADARITKVGEVKIEHRIASITRPGAAVVEAEGDVLRLKSALRGLAMARVDRNEAVAFSGRRSRWCFHDRQRHFR